MRKIGTAYTNSRMRDFYDIYLLSDIKFFNGKVLQKAILSTLQRREIPIEKKMYFLPRNWNLQGMIIE